MQTSIATLQIPQVLTLGQIAFKKVNYSEQELARLFVKAAHHKNKLPQDFIDWKHLVEKDINIVNEQLYHTHCTCPTLQHSISQKLKFYIQAIERFEQNILMSFTCASNNAVKVLESLQRVGSRAKLTLLYLEV